MALEIRTLQLNVESTSGQRAAEAFAASLRAVGTATKQAAGELRGGMESMGDGVATAGAKMGTGIAKAGASIGQGLSQMGVQAEQLRAKSTAAYSSTASAAEQAAGKVDNAASKAADGTSRFSRELDKIKNSDAFKTISSQITGHVSPAMEKISKWAIEIATTITGFGVLSPILLGVTSQLGTLGNVLVATGTLWFVFSSRALAARTALYGFLEALGLTHIGIRIFNGVLGGIGAAFGLSRAGALTFLGTIGAVILGVKAASDIMERGSARMKEYADFARGLRGNGDLGNRDNFDRLNDLSFSLPGASRADVRASYTTLTRAGAGNSDADLKALAGAALYAQKPITELAEKMAALQTKLLALDKDGVKGVVEDLRKMELVSAAAGTAILGMAGDAGRVEEAYKIASAELGKFSSLVDQKAGTYENATKKLSGAWDELKTQFSEPFAAAWRETLEALVPLVSSFAGALRSLIPIAKTVGETLATVANVMGTIRDLGAVLGHLSVGDTAAAGKIITGDSGTTVSAAGVPIIPPPALSTAALKAQLAALEGEKDKSGGGKGGGGKGATTYQTDADLVKKYREEIEYLNKAQTAGSVSALEFSNRQWELKKSLASSLSDPQKYAEDVDAWRAAWAEKEKILSATKERIEAGMAGMGESISYGLEKALSGFGKFQKQLSEAIPNAINNAADSFGTAVSGFVTGSKSAGAAVKEFSLSVIGDVSKMIGKLLFLQLVEKALGFFGFGGSSLTSGSKNIASGLSIGTGHTGAILGSPAGWRSVEMPRFHGGGLLGPGEVPFIGKDDEGIYTSGQMRAMAPLSMVRQAVSTGGGSRQTSIAINFNGNGGRSEESSGDNDAFAQSLSREIADLVDSRLDENFRSGGRFDHIRK